MKLDGISVFVKVVEAGSFSGAARLLNMPKTTVSAKIAALEKRLRVKLIQRTTRKLRVAGGSASRALTAVRVGLARRRRVQR
jgi:DNA-binding transcriptional LysR family regulator